MFSSFEVKRLMRFHLTHNLILLENLIDLTDLQSFRGVSKTPRIEQKKSLSYITQSLPNFISEFVDRSLMLFPRRAIIRRNEEKH